MGIVDETVHIRKATYGDHGAIAGIADPIYDEHAQVVPSIFRAGQSLMPLQHIRTLVDSPNADILVAETTSETVGFIVVSVQDAPHVPVLIPRRTTHIEFFAVHPLYRGKGLGHRLMGAAVAWATEHSADELELTVYEFNTTAISFYEGVGMHTRARTMAFPLNTCERVPCSEF